MTPANNVRISDCTFNVDDGRYVHRVDGDVIPPPESHTIRPTPAPSVVMNRHERRRYAALSRRSQTR